MNIRRVGVAALICGVMGLLLQAPASATFPGTNGKIAFDDYIAYLESYHIFVVNPDGTDLIDLTPSATFSAEPNWSPDGKRIVFISFDPRHGIYVMNADGSRRKLLVAGDEQNPAFSPDGRSIVFERYGAHMGLGLLTLETGRFRQLTDDGFLDSGPDWSPDGSKIVFVRGSGNLWVINADGTGLTQLTDTLQDGAPVWSPDGTQITFTRTGGYPRYSDVWVMNADASEQRNVTAGLADGIFLDSTWSPDGTQLALMRYPDCWSGGLITVNVDGTGETGVYCNFDDPRHFSWQPG